MKTCAIALFLLALNVPALAESGKPNVVIIFTDDQGYQDLGCFGSTLYNLRDDVV